MTWQYPETAPVGVPLRVAARGKGSEGTRELCYELIKMADGGWCYARTMAPIFEWHKPVFWTDEPRTAGEQAWFEEAAELAHGYAGRPSWDNDKRLRS